jgi:SAM-dependent methyltransferase
MDRLEASKQPGKQEELNYLEQKFWDGKAQESPCDGKYRPVHPSKHIENLVNDFISENVQNVLEIGCNTGYSSVYFTQKGFEYTGVDISSESIRIAQETFYGSKNCKFHVSKAEKLPFENECFDLIFCRDVLHHCNFSQALEEIYRVVKKKGKAVLIETTITNKLIKLASRYMKNETEYPLVQNEIQMITNVFSKVTIAGYDFFRLFLLIPFVGRKRIFAHLLNAIDDFLFYSRFKRLFTFLSYEKVFLIKK